MIISPKGIPEIHRLIAETIAANGGSYSGTNNLCQEIPADRNNVLKSLRTFKKYQLIQSRHSSCGRGRGHKTIWKLTQKGKDYVQSK